MSPLAHLKKEGGEAVLGVLFLPPLAWLAWGLATTTGTAFISATSLLHINSLGHQRRRKCYRNALPGRASWCTQASGVGKRAQMARDCRTVSPQLLGAFLNSLPFTPSGSICLTRAPELGVPGLSFWKVINEFENTELSKPAPETQALSIGRAWL